MCGIVGFWRFDGSRPGDASCIEAMSKRLQHRGPDDHGYLAAESAGTLCLAGHDPLAAPGADLRLASRRLAVIDASPAGWQPFGNARGDVFVVFNGAVYNHVELRRELEGLGYAFHSKCDTEVILHAYEAWGVQCTTRFNGMWAFAIWDQRRRQLVLSRDRFGIKPLYITRQPGLFAFASELKALLPVLDVVEPDMQTVARYLDAGQVDTTAHSFVAGVESLPAAHSLVVTATGAELSQYWSYPHPAPAGQERDAVETFAALLDDAVRLRLRASVPVGVLLSGGVDSSAIAAAASQRESPLRAYTAVFPGFWGDEQRHAATVARHLRLPLETVEYNPTDFVADVKHATWHMDAPMLQGQVMPRSALLRAASTGVTVVLEGQGADELLGGYPGRYVRPHLHDVIDQLRPWNAIATAKEAWRTMGIGTWRRQKLKRALAKRRHHRPLLRLLSPAVRSSLIPQSGPDSDAPQSPYPDALRTELWRDHRRNILPQLLHFGDAMSMAHSVESRLPYLDYRLVDLVFRLNGRLRLRQGETKWLLRSAVDGRLPREIVHRRQKVGFDTPLRQWVDGSVEDIREVLLSPRARQRDILSAPAVERLLTSRDTIQDNAALLRCLALELWFQQFIDTPHSAAP